MHRLSPRYALPAILLILAGALGPTIRLMTDLPAAATDLSAVDTRVILHVEATTLRISFLVALATTALATCVSLLIREPVGQPVPAFQRKPQLVDSLA